MIAWSIHAALSSRAFNAVLVSTDDQQIAAIAEAEGAESPFVRPPDLSGDFTATMPVIRHALSWWNTNRYPVDFAACIYATAPFLKPRSLSLGLKRLQNSTADFVLAVTGFEYPVQRSLRLGHDNTLTFADPEYALKRSQELEPRYHDAGQFFAGRTAAIYNYDAVPLARCLPVLVPNHDALDIDTPEDWRIAELRYRLNNI